METVTIEDENSVTRLSEFKYFTFITTPNTETIGLTQHNKEFFTVKYLLNKSSIFCIYLENFQWSNQGRMLFRSQHKALD